MRLCDFLIDVLDILYFVLFLDEFVDKLLDLAQLSSALGLHHLLLDKKKYV